MYASYQRRIFSYLIDGVLAQIIFGASIFLIAPFVDNLFLAQFLCFLISIIWVIFSFPFLQSSRWQASIGQKLLRIRTVDVKGNTLSFWRACYRGATSIFCFWGIFMYFFSPQKQCLHDFFCDTVVINNKPFKTNIPRPLRPIKYSIIIIAAVICYLIPLLLLAKVAWLN